MGLGMGCVSVLPTFLSQSIATGTGLVPDKYQPCTAQRLQHRLVSGEVVSAPVTSVFGQSGRVFLGGERG